MGNGEHDERGNMPSSLSSSLLRMNPAGASLAKMKVTNSSSTNHGLTNLPGGLNTHKGSFTNPSNISAEDLTTGLSNPHVVTETHAASLLPELLNPKASEDVQVPASLKSKPEKRVNYRECLKNHAVHIGVHATDGCGEFIPSGAEGTLESFTCAACHCHRNFHRRETEGELASCSECNLHGSFMSHPWLDVRTCAFPAPLPASAPTLHSAYAASRGVNTDSEDISGRCALMPPRSPAILKKRFRTKFTEEQKERMAAFAEALGWRMQKQDEEVDKFCREVGVRRQVFKVWMHNNKLTVGRKVPCLTMTSEKAEA